MALTPGTRFGAYEITAAIGAGGMGEVYRAKDTKLGRDVALKILPPTFTTDPDRLARFRREAQVLASLNHPHIGAIYGLDEANGTQFLVLELVDGESLDRRIARGPIPVNEALGIARQIAEALEAAHEKGIIHRDLKPANIALTKGGQVKVLDFGLAKTTEPASGRWIEVTDSPTIGSPAQTSIGVLLGTAAYMSPEQVRGKSLDRRADIWAFGCVLYEMLTARRAFRGGTFPEIAASVLDHEPDWQALPHSTPANVHGLVRRALQKDPQRRLRDIGDARLELEEARHRPTRLLQQLRLVAAAFMAVLLIGTIIGLSSQRFRSRLIGTGRLRRIESVAVLPLENLSRDPEQEYFAEGMTDALITDLAQIKALRVISRTSVMRYKGTNKPLPQIARELNVDGILEGAVQRSGSRVRITAQLVDGSSDRHLWAHSYERDLRDVLQLQDEIGQAVAREVQVELSPQERARLTTGRPVNPDAYEAYLRGRYYWNRVTEESIKQAIGYFGQAIAKDPQYAAGYAGLADCYTILGSTILGGVTPREAMPQAKDAALKALEIDSTLAEAHASLAMVTWRYDWDWVTGEREFNRAIELNPGYSTAHQWYGWYLYGLGRTADSLTELTRAQQADPLSVWIHSNKGLALFFARQYDRAVPQLRETLRMDATFVLGHFFLGLALEQQGSIPEALAQFEEAVRLSGGSPEYVAAMGHAYAVSGKRIEAQKTLGALTELALRRYVPAYEVAIIYVGLHEIDRAMAWLEKAYEERGGWLVYLRVDPRLDQLRSDRRFQRLLQRIGIPNA